MENKKKPLLNPPRWGGLLIFLLFSLVMESMGWAQYSKYWIQFTDKNNNPYSISAPNAFLSARAIQRRINQNIPVVQNDLPITPAYIDSVKNVPNVSVINRSKWFNAITIYTTDANALNTILNFPFVASIQPVQRHYRKMEIEENKSPVLRTNIKHQISNISYNYGPSFNQINMIGGVCLHNQGYDGSGMVIAVMDAGFYRADSLPVFDSLRANGQILGTWDFVDNDSTVYDAHWHGTMVLSTMGGNLPGYLVGTAPKAKYWLFRTEQSASEYIIEEDNWVSAAEFADSAGADIFNTSLGYTTFDDPSQNHTYADMNGNTTRITIATDLAASKGILPVCSAGNSGASPWNFIGAPADADSVLAVGAVDSLGNYASFSSNGPTYDGRVKPNVAAQGQDCVVADPWNGGITRLSGTSFSSPITAGLVACLWQAHPSATNMQLFNAIQQTASQFTSPDTLLGYGISDFCAANALLTSVNEHLLMNDALIVYPNPNNGNFTIQMNAEQLTNGTLKIYNLLGQKVFEKNIYDKKAEVNCNLVKGIYQLKVETNTVTVNKKIVIQ
jgi:subtilisin family serine protease